MHNDVCDSHSVRSPDAEVVSGEKDRRDCDLSTPASNRSVALKFLLLPPSYGAEAHHDVQALLPFNPDTRLGFLNPRFGLIGAGLPLLP